MTMVKINKDTVYPYLYLEVDLAAYGGTTVNIDTVTLKRWKEVTRLHDQMQKEMEDLVYGK